MLDNQTATSPATFDRASLLERVDGDESLLVIVIEVFLEDSPNAIQAIDQALASMDAAQLRLAAHALKGAAANISAEAVRAAAHDLEKTAEAGRLAEAPAHTQRVKDAMAALTPLLATVLQDSRNGAC
jgi:HPt (histidine-containing phosphotransfer) domain-containing protein